MNQRTPLFKLDPLKFPLLNEDFRVGFVIKRPIQRTAVILHYPSEMKLKRMSLDPAVSVPVHNYLFGCTKSAGEFQITASAQKLVGILDEIKQHTKHPHDAALRELPAHLWISPVLIHGSETVVDLGDWWTRLHGISMESEFNPNHVEVQKPPRNSTVMYATLDDTTFWSVSFSENSISFAYEILGRMAIERKLFS